MTPTNPVAPLRRLVDDVLRVGDLVAGTVATFDSDERCDRVLAAMNAQRFDVVGVGEPPIRHCVEIGTLEQADPECRVGDLARAVLAEDCVDPSLSLAEFIGLMGRREFVFVLRGDEIGSIATRADLQAPTVTVSVLAHLVSIELGLATLVPRALGKDWLRHLRKTRRDAALDLLARKQQANVESGLEDCLYFSDWLELGCEGPVLECLSYSKAEYKKATGPFTDLRNELAHGGTILDGASAHKAIDRFRRIREVFERTWDAVDHTDEMWKTYLDTDILVGGEPFCGPGAGERVHVITAWNPMSVSRSEQMNRAANAELRAVLVSHDLEVVDAIGRSRSGDWREESFSVAGASRNLISRLGDQFGQKAIFEIADTELRVVRCVDARVIRTRSLAST